MPQPAPELTSGASSPIRALKTSSDLHALSVNVTEKAHILTTQVAKNALLTLRDLWRGLGDMLDPELPMVCPVFVKKMADKVEFLAEVAREVSRQSPCSLQRYFPMRP